MNSGSHYNSINFLKIVSTILITLLLASTFEKGKMTDKQYIVSRYKKIWPHFIWGFIVYFAMLFVRHWPDIRVWGYSGSFVFGDIFASGIWYKRVFH